MRFVRSWILSLATATLAACGSSFSSGQAPDAGSDGPDASTSVVVGRGPGDAATEGPAPEASIPDATATTDAGDGGGSDEAGEEAGREAGEGAAPGCPGGDIQCGGTCVPSDVHNCGTCGHDCTNLAHVAGATSCTAGGACTFPPSACAVGWADCNGQPDDGCETNITTPSACGSCTKACSASDPECAGGACVTGCPTQTPVLCGSTCVDTTSNANDCDACGKACTTAVANAQPTCANSACTFACNADFTGCPPPPAAPTACVNEQDDANNCGTCNKMCAGPTSGAGQAACAKGACTLDCNAGLTACPVVGPTECANTMTDTSNCGTCGHICSTAVKNASETCQGSQCVFACNTGFVSCGSTCIPGPVNGVFVSPSGSGAACTEAAPCSSISVAIGVAMNGGETTVYLDKGTYSEALSLDSTANMAIQGGWTFTAPNIWTTCNNGASTSSIISAPISAPPPPTAVTVSAGTWTLDTLTIDELNTPSVAAPGQTVYGVFVVGGTVTLKNVSIQVASGGTGGSGSQGSAGAPGSSVCSAGTGAAGAVGAAAGLGPQGSYSPMGFTPGNGLSGLAGGPGQNGTQPVAPACIDYTDLSCAGVPPNCTSSNVAAECCGTAGTVGCGGGGSGPGTPGYGGGASIGVFVAAGSVSFESPVSIQTGTGGAGGPGASGGTIGSGSLGTTGRGGTRTTACGQFINPDGVKLCGQTNSIVECSGSAGSQGGAGGQGGTGGGGAGGDSFCYATPAGGGTAGTSVTCNHGSGGPGGTGGSQGPTGRSG
jgi:hypothetical protein